MGFLQEGNVQNANQQGQMELGEVEGEVQPEPLDMRFPSKGLDKQLTYLALFPIIFPLWLTLPDTRAESGKCSRANFKNSKKFQGAAANGGETASSGEEEDSQPLDLSWPDSCRERITYVLFLPIIIPLWLTLPDTRKASGILVRKKVV